MKHRKSREEEKNFIIQQFRSLHALALKVSSVRFPSFFHRNSRSFLALALSLPFNDTRPAKKTSLFYCHCII